MSKLDELIAELCLDGVEYVKLGDVIKLEKGKQLNKEFLTEQGKYPAYNGGVTHSGFTDKYNYDENKIIISQGGASAGFVNFVKTKFWANAHCYVVLPIEHYINNRYAYHFIKSKQTKLMDKQHGAGIPALRSSEINNLKIPLPPLPVQQEIVRILDTFTELIKELNAELEARRKQYEYYRDLLLTFGDEVELIAELCPNGVEYKKLKEVASVSIGEFVHKNKQNPNGVYPVYNGGTSNTGFYDEFNRTANKIIISARGANAGFVNRVFVDFWAGNSCYTISVEEKYLDWNFTYYVLKSSENNLINQQQKGGIPAVSKKQLEEFYIPVPPLPVQQEIVRILDNFTELIAELTAELTARQKQYEYYRDKLLSFKEVSS